MKRHKAGPIGLVIGDETIRAAQELDGRLIEASVEIGENLKKALRQVMAAVPFVGRDVVVGIEGRALLIESFVLPPSSAKDARKYCTDRLKGDPLFDSEKAVLGVAVEAAVSTEGGNALAIMVALNRERLGELMKACRDAELVVQAVEAAAPASWRAWPSQGLEVRLVRSSGQDAILAGRDGKLLFCRIVDAPVEGSDLKATLSRAASLAGGEAFESLKACGLDEAEREALASAIDLRVEAPPTPVADASASGLARPGSVLADFTPPEERVLRQKRHVRKVSVAMAAACGVLVLVTGLLGTHELTSLKDERTALDQRKQNILADKTQLEQVNALLAREEGNESVILQARPGHRMSSLLALVTVKAGDGVSFETMKIDDVELAAESGEDAAAPRRRALDMRLNGLARSALAVRQFADALLASGAFADVRVEASERVLLGVGAEGERFRIFARAETH